MTYTVDDERYLSAQQKGILFVFFHQFSAAEPFTPIEQAFGQNSSQYIPVQIRSLQGTGRIPDILRELFLGYVDADADHDSQQSAVFVTGCFAQDPGDFLSVQVQVVDPFDAAGDSRSLLHSFPQGDSRCDGRLCQSCVFVIRVNDQGIIQTALRGKEGMPVPASACCLFLCQDQGSVRCSFLQQFSCPLVGRSDLIVNVYGSFTAVQMFLDFFLPKGKDHCLCCFFHSHHYTTHGRRVRIRTVLRRNYCMTDRIMQIGIIGNGKSANRYHAPFILNRPDTMKIKTIWARNLNKQDWARIEGTHYTEDLNELLNDPEIDAVIITLPHHLHYEYAKKAIEAGKNTVVEKPFTENSAQAEELFALAEEKGVMLQCYQNRRFDSDYLTVQKVIESGVLGDLLELEMHFDYYRPEIPESIHEFKPYMSYLYGHGCHTLDQVIAYFGEPDRIHYDVRQLLGEGRMNDYFDLDLYYGVLKVSVKSSYFRIKERPSFILYGKKGMFVKAVKDRQEYDLKHFYLPAGQPDFGCDTPAEYGVLTYEKDGVIHEETVPTVKGDYARYYDALYETVINGAQPLVRKEQTLLQMRILEEGIRNCR